MIELARTHVVEDPQIALLQAYAEMDSDPIADASIALQALRNHGLPTRIDPVTPLEVVIDTPKVTIASKSVAPPAAKLPPKPPQREIPRLRSAGIPPRIRKATHSTSSPRILQQPISRKTQPKNSFSESEASSDELPATPPVLRQKSKEVIEYEARLAKNLNNPSTVRLIQRTQTGDTAALEKVCKLALPYVRFVASTRKIDSNLPFDEQVQAGLIGLLHSIKTYVPGIALFTTHADKRIRGAIVDAERAEYSQQGLPRTALTLLKEAREPGAPTNLLLHQMVKKGYNVKTNLSLEQEHGTDSGETITLGSKFGQHERGYKEVEFDSEGLTDTLSRLPERQRMVMYMYYYEGLTLSEIGEIIGVTESRVSQLHTKGLEELREALPDGLDTDALFSDDHPSMMQYVA